MWRARRVLGDLMIRSLTMLMHGERTNRVRMGRGGVVIDSFLFHVEFVFEDTSGGAGG